MQLPQELSERQSLSCLHVRMSCLDSPVTPMTSSEIAACWPHSVRGSQNRVWSFMGPCHVHILSSSWIHLLSPDLPMWLLLPKLSLSFIPSSMLVALATAFTELCEALTSVASVTLQQVFIQGSVINSRTPSGWPRAGQL